MSELLKKFAVVLAAFGLVVCMLTGCLSAPATETPAEPEDNGDDIVVVDWQNKSLGAPIAPEWLLPLLEGDDSTYLTKFKLPPTTKVIVSQSTGASDSIAITAAKTQVSANLAAQLKTTVNTEAASVIADDGQRAAFEDIAQKSMVTFSGWEQKQTFWQKRRVTNKKTGASKDEYVGYVVYITDANNWNKIVAKFQSDIFGDPSLTEETRDKTGRLFDEMKVTE